MILQSLVLLLAFGLAQAWDPQLQCHFHLRARNITLVPNNGLENFLSDDVSLGNFTELTTENVKPLISKPGLMELLKERLGEYFMFDLQGYCFPKLEPGQEWGIIRTVNPVVGHMVEFEKFDSSLVKPLRETYPNVTSDEVLLIFIGLNLTFNAEDFFISYNTINAWTDMQMNVPYTENRTISIFPYQEPDTKLEWYPTENESQERPDLESDYFCALDLSEKTKMELLSRGQNTPVYAFKLAENQEGTSEWESTPNPGNPDKWLYARRRFYIKKNTRAAYYMTPIADDNEAFCYSLVFNNDDTQHQK